MFDLLKELGLFALPFSGRVDGGTGNMLSACIAVEELGRVCYNTGYCWSCNGSPSEPCWRRAVRSRKPVSCRVSPGRRAAPGASRPPKRKVAPGYSPASKRTPAAPGGYLLSGAKIWCTNADIADFLLVGAKTAGPDGRESVNLFIVEKGTPGLHR